MEQNEKGLMQWEKDFLISVTILIIATIIAHIFFYQTAHNINVPMIIHWQLFLSQDIQKDMDGELFLHC